MIKMNRALSPALTFPEAPFSALVGPGPLPATYCFASNGDEYVGGGKPKSPDTTDAPQSITARNGGSVQPISYEQIREMLTAGRSNEISSLGSLAVEPLIVALDKEVELRWQTIRILWKIGDRRAVEALIARLNDQYDWRPNYAAWALGRIGDPRAVEPLIKALSAKEFEVRNGAAHSLGLFRDRRAFAPLISFLFEAQDAYPFDGAARSLSQIDNARAVEYFKAILNDPESPFHYRAARALQILLPRDVREDSDEGEEAKKENVLAASWQEDEVGALLERLEKGDIDDRTKADVVGQLLSVDKEQACAHACKLLWSEDFRVVESMVILIRHSFPLVVDPIFERFFSVATGNGLRETLLLFSTSDKSYIQYQAAEFLLRNPHVLKKDPRHIHGIAEERGWYYVMQIARREENKQRINHLDDRVRETAHAVQMRLGDALNSTYSIETASEADKDYGAITAISDLEHVLNVDPGSTLEEATERLRSLNFLVHHEVAHAVQNNFSIPGPSIDEEAHDAFDEENVQHHANETMVDKLAFEMAWKIYVHNDGDALFDEETRAMIAIKAYLTSSTMVERDHHGGREFTPAFFARQAAVARELAKHDAITARMKDELKELSQRFRAKIISRKLKRTAADADRLIRAYAKIFRETKLEVSQEKQSSITM